MKNSNVGQELIYAAGGQWLLERIVLTDDNKIVYCRMDDHLFSTNDTSIDDIWDGSECITFYCLELTEDYCPEDVIELIDIGYREIFNEMLTDFAKADKTLKVASVTSPPATVVSEYHLIEALSNYIKLCNDKTNTGTQAGWDAWYDMTWTIGFNGMTIEVGNSAAIYNAIQQWIKEEAE